MSRMPVGIVTGASRGLGLALARALVERGWRLVLDARGEDALAAAVAGLGGGVNDGPRAAGNRGARGVTAIAGDIADPAHRKALVAAAGDRIDFLVNNASTLGPSPQPALADYPLEELRRVYEVNVLAPQELTRL